MLYYGNNVSIYSELFLQNALVHFFLKKYDFNIFQRIFSPPPLTAS